MPTRFETRFATAGAGLDQVFSAHGETVTYTPGDDQASAFSILAIFRETVGALDSINDTVFAMKAYGNAPFYIDAALTIIPNPGDYITRGNEKWTAVKVRVDGGMFEIRCMLPQEWV